MRGISPQANRATNSPTKQPRAVGHNLSLSQRRSQSFSHFRQGSTRSGFTIVELLIVVVVIAILAAITIVAYNGITANAKDSALKADLNTTAKKVGLTQAETGSYPSSKPAGLPDTIQYSQTSSGQGFCATASKDGKAFHITESGTIQNGACSGHTIAGGGGGGTPAASASIEILSDGSSYSSITGSGFLAGEEVEIMWRSNAYIVTADGEGGISWEYVGCSNIGHLQATGLLSGRVASIVDAEFGNAC